MSDNYTNPNFIKETFKSQIWDMQYKPVETWKNYKLSIVTTCMGRVADLSQTLPYNLHPQMEIVLINYNSKDNLDDYIKTNHMKDIQEGRLSYYKTTEPQFYSMSHSRNIGYRVAKGDIICSIDADNWLGDRSSTYHEFGNTLITLANQCNNAFFGKGIRNTHGQLGFYKKHFEQLGGYDETMCVYGLEDRDILLRAFNMGLSFYYWGGKHCHRIETSTKNKLSNNLIKSIKQSEDTNRIILNKNYESKVLKVNPNGYGKAKLLKNFKEEVILN